MKTCINVLISWDESIKSRYYPQSIKLFNYKKSLSLFSICSLLLFLTFSSCKNSNSIHSGQNDFVQIFNGKNLDGWKGDPNYWRVENGTLVGEVTPETLLDRNSFIIWQGDMPSDFELKVEYRVTKNGNSGINYRSEKVEGVPYALKGYQADLDGANHYTGMNYEERKRTILALPGQKVLLKPVDKNIQTYIQNNRWTESIELGSLGNLDSLKANIKNEDWNKYHLVVKGNRMQHYINGVLMSDVTDEDTINRRFDGLLGVQVHVGPPMKIEYRNFMLRKLN